MGVSEEELVTLAGGAPWGFRLQGGSQQHKPLQVAKIRKRGKAWRAGFRENDVLLSINGRSCSGISHADAMNIIDSSDGIVHIWVKRVSSRAASGSFQSEPSSLTSPCARRQEASKAAVPVSEARSVSQSRGQRLSYTSPPDSEAYYGETDSDADYSAGEKQRKQKRKCPGAAPRHSVNKPFPSSADEASELSEYDSAPEPPRDPPAPSTFTQLQHGAHLSLDQPSLSPGVVPRSREIMFQPRRVEAKINIWQPKVEMAFYPNPTPKPNPSPTITPNSNPTPKPNASPTITPNSNPTPKPNPSPTITPNSNPTPKPNPSPTITPNPNPTITPNPNPTITPNPNPTITPNPNPIITPSPNPTITPNPNPIITPSPNPTITPNPNPIITPKSNPTITPNPNPTITPKSNPIITNNPNPTSPITWSAQPSVEDSTNRQGILGTSEADSGFQEVPPHTASSEQKLLPTRSQPSLRDTQLVPMVGPVNNPVDEILTTTYKEKAKQAKLHRSESTQEKQVKEARTKCKTIASLLTSAPNPHSKGVLMFKKRRQRAKKYTLVSYGSVDEEKQNIDEDGELLPTSESEFDEEAFSDAKSLTNQSTGSDWDGSYLDIEKPKSEPQGLNETKGKGVMLFEHQRQRAGEYMVEESPVQRQHNLQMKPKSEVEVRNYSMMNGESTWPRNSNMYSGSLASDTLNNSAEMNLSPGVRVEPSLQVTRPSEQHHSQHFVQGPSCLSSVTNRTARPFTPGFQQSQAPMCSVSAPVLFKQSAAPAVSWEQATGRNKLAMSFSPPPEAFCTPTVNPMTQPVTVKKAVAPKRMEIPYSSPPAVMSPPPAVMSPPPPVMSPPSVMSPPPPVMSPPSVMSPPPPVMSPPSVMLSPPTVMSPPSAVPLVNPYSPPLAPVTSTATFRVSSALPPKKEAEPAAVVIANTQAPSIGSTSSTAWSANQPSENLGTREQRISIPASKTGILREACRRSTRKPMFTKTEQIKPSPNPELLSLVQNLDEKKADHIGAGFESGPEEDFLSLGAEASNFMQSQARRQKVPPPVAPKPSLKPHLIGNGSPVVNGNTTSGTFQLKGKGAELFAKRQSRMDKFIVQSVPTYTSQPRAPSPTPSLPSTWKYSPNIRAPPPIGYNPMHSPSYPPAACRSQVATSATKTDRKWKPAGSQKVGIQAIDFMRHQPYQLNPAMFSFDESKVGTQSLPRSAPPRQLGQQSFISTKHIPVKTTRACEIRRFSTPVPTVTPTVIAPRSATTLAEPVWMSAPTFPPPAPVKVSSVNLPAPQTSKQNRRVPEGSQEVTAESSVLHFSPKEDIQVQKKTLHHVPRPRFSAVRGGMNPHTWRPGSF